MVGYIARRFGAGVLVLICVTSLTFLLYNLRGGEATARAVLGPQASPEELALKVQQLGLDRPLAVQYLDWAAGAVRGDLGRSFISSQDVTAIMSTRVPVSLSLIVLTLAITLLLSVLLGVLAASRGGVLDRAIQTTAVIVGAVPGYWLALVMVIVFAINLRLVPATGFIPISQSVIGWFSTVILPCIAIALGPGLALAVWIRSSIVDIRRQDFVRTLRSRGISERAVMFRHVLRNAAPSTIQMLGLLIIALLGGTVIVERIFNLPGIGMMALSAGQAGDIPVVLAGVTFMVLVIVVINLAVDILNAFLNPKVRSR